MPRIWALPKQSLKDEEEQDPNFLMVYGSGLDSRDHIWIHNEHYEQSDSREAVVGKCYYSPEPEIFYRVKEFEESSDEPVTEYGVENAHQKVILEILVGPNGVVDVQPDHDSKKTPTDWAHRYQLESVEMGMKPFDRR